MPSGKGISSIHPATHNYGMAVILALIGPWNKGTFFINDPACYLEISIFVKVVHKKRLINRKGI